MLVKLVEMYFSNDCYRLRSIHVNPEHVSFIRPDDDQGARYRRHHEEGKAFLELDENVEFTRISVSSGTGFTSFTIVGSEDLVSEKLNKGNGKTLLKG